MRFSNFVAASMPALVAADFYVTDWVCQLGLDSDYDSSVTNMAFQFDSQDACDAASAVSMDGNDYHGTNPCNSDDEDPLTLRNTGDGTWDLIVDNTGIQVGTCTYSDAEDIKGACTSINYGCVVNSRVKCSTAYCVG